MQPFQFIVLTVVLFGLLISACNQPAPQELPIIENIPTISPESTSTSSPAPPTATPVPPTPTPQPPPTPINLIALEEDLEAFLSSHEPSMHMVTLSETLTITNNSTDVIHVSEATDLLHYYQQVDPDKFVPIWDSGQPNNRLMVDRVA